jgi:hypothetical protein
MLCYRCRIYCRNFTLNRVQKSLQQWLIISRTMNFYYDYDSLSLSLSTISYKKESERKRVKENVLNKCGKPVISPFRPHKPHLHLHLNHYTLIAIRNKWKFTLWKLLSPIVKRIHKFNFFSAIWFFLHNFYGLWILFIPVNG